MRGAMTRHHAFLPILAAMLAVASLSLMDAYMKSAALALGALTAAWLRSALGTAIALPLWLGRGGKRPRPEVLRLHIRRGVISTFMALTFFYSLTKLPIAEAIAISFIAPLIALYLARLLLGEVIRKSAIVASMFGFAGTLVIVGGKVGRNDFDSDAALGLAAILVSALLYAYNFILIRRQSQMAGPAEIAVFHSGVSVVLLGLAMPFAFNLPDARIWFDLAMAALLTVAGAMGMAWAYAREEAQTLVPLEYSGFLWASLFGWLFFQEEVTATTLLGTAIIVVACLIAARRKPKQPAQAAL